MPWSRKFGDQMTSGWFSQVQGIHDYEPSTKEVAQIYDADVFVYHSQTLESWAGRLDPNLQGSKLRSSSKGMTLDKVAGLEDVEAGQERSQAFIWSAYLVDL